MKAKLYRSTLKSGSIMSGYYKYSDVFQLLESKKTSPTRRGKYFDIEYNEAYSRLLPAEIKIESEDHAFAVDRQRERAHLDFLKELVALLSVVMNQYCEIDFNKEVHILPDTQERIFEFSDVSSTHEIRRDPNRISQRQNFTMSFVSIHPEADAFFNNYFKLDDVARSKYNASIFLYQSMRKIFLTSASMAIVGLISAIENLMELERVRNKIIMSQCKECKSPIYKISARFKEFMLKYSEFEVDNKNKLLNKFYSRRSEISHTGAILEIDQLISRFSMQEHREFTEIETHVRIALFNYLLKYDFQKTSA